jgi:tetratricopeptide (TPR) repeat protein
MAALAGVVALGLVWWRVTLGSEKDPMRLALLHSALNEFNAERYERATAILDRRAQAVMPTSLDWMLRARIAEAQGRLADAREDLKHIPDSDLISSQAWLKAGRIEVKLHRARAGEAAYRRALALNPDQVQGYRELAYLYALERRKAECDAQFRALNERVPLSYIMAFAWCQNYCELWDPNEAIPILSHFIAADPANRDSRLALASCYEATNRIDEALAVLSPLPDSDPDARALRIQLAIDRGEIDTARKLERDGPSDHLRRNVLRGQLAVPSDAALAADYYRAALRRDPEDRDAIHGLGVALRKLGSPQAEKYLDLAARHDELRRTIQKSVSAIETDPKLFFRLGEICKSVDRLVEARVWYHLAIARDPLDTQAQQALGRLTPGGDQEQKTGRSKSE